MRTVGTSSEPVALEVESPMLGVALTTNPAEAFAEVKAVAGTIQDEAFMSLLMAINDTRKRVLILAILSFLAMC
jgi:hypothetical protein